MKLNFNDTRHFIESVLSTSPGEATKVLNTELRKARKTVPQFYDGVIEHGPKMPLTDLQWFDFHNKVDHWRLRDEKSLMDKLSPNQREALKK